jgi:hypothetical protein
LNQSREAHHPAWPLHSPRGGLTSSDPGSRQRGGTRVAGVGTRVGTSVPTSVGVQALGHGGAGSGPAGLRSLPAKQHAPKARPLPATDRGRRRRLAGVPVKRDRGRRPGSPAGWCRLRRPPDPAAAEPGRLIALDSGAMVPQLHHRPPGRAWWPACRGGTSHGCGCQLSQGDRRHRLVVAPVPNPWG